MKVFVVDQIHPDAVALLREHVEAVLWDDAAVAGWPAEADGIVVRGTVFDRPALNSAAKLRVVARHGVGYDNIDLDAARDCGIAVTNTPGANTNAVVEMTVALALAVGRRIALSDRLLRAGDTAPAPDRMGVELGGGTLGVVGVGAIGSGVAAAFQRGFGKRVLGCDPYLDEARWAELADVMTPVDLDTLLAESDMVSLHTPLTDETRGMIGVDALAAMKPGAILLSVARGGVVDEAALHDALVSGHLGGAGLDVFVTEPPPQDHPLLALDTLVATPHLGGMSEQGMIGMGVTAVEEVLRVLRGEAPRFKVN